MGGAQNLKVLLLLLYVNKTNYFFALKSNPQTPIFRQIKIPKEYRYHSEGTPTRK